MNQHILEHLMGDYNALTLSALVHIGIRGEWEYARRGAKIRGIEWKDKDVCTRVILPKETIHILREEVGDAHTTFLLGHNNLWFELRKKDFAILSACEILSTAQYDSLFMLTERVVATEIVIGEY